jgi:hypothetical protein
VDYLILRGLERTSENVCAVAEKGRFILEPGGKILPLRSKMSSR